MRTCGARSGRLAFVVLLLSLSGCAAKVAADGAEDEALAETAGSPRRAHPARPAHCRDVAAGSALQSAIEAAAPGDALCLSPGIHVGPIVIERAITLWGPRDAIVRSRGTGTTVTVRGPKTQLLGFGVDGSGVRHDLDDAAVHVGADDVVVEGIEVTRATFGVMIEKANRVQLRGCRVVGLPDVVSGLRGDAVRLWETRDSVIEGNDIESGRDLVVWYSPRNVFRSNRIAHGRYGAHFMYSGDNDVLDNELVGNVVGVFVMYSRNLRLRGNRFVDSSGGAGMGVGLKESGNVIMEHNLFVHDTIGLYVDTSPLYRGDQNRFEGNRFLLSGTAVTFHGRSEGNLFRGNDLRGNRAQVEVEGGGDARESRWEGNWFDDYAGYDLDDDGSGDVPYALRSLSGQLTAKYPETAYFRGTPALGIIEVLGTLVPLVTPRTLIVDERPRMRALRAAIAMEQR